MYPENSSSIFRQPQGKEIEETRCQPCNVRMGCLFKLVQIASASLVYGKRRPDAFLQLVATNRQQTKPLSSERRT